MSVRIRITLVFTLVVMLIWAIVCVAIYYFSSASRVDSIRLRLTNRAITTARLLEHSEIFDQELIRQIDSVTTLALKRKSVQAYRADGTPVYYYSELPDDTLSIEPSVLADAVSNGNIYFTSNGKDVAVYHNPDSREQLVVVCAADDLEGKSELRQLLHILALCFIGGTAVTFAGGYLFSGKLLQPVKKIANEIKEISAYSLDRRLDESNRHDEWQYLTSTVNELLDRLKESFELQRRFISNASHELSTPLTLISSQLEISLQRDRSDKYYRDTMQVVLQDVQHMSNLVQTLLKIATASGSAGGLEIQLIRIDEILMRIPAEMQRKDKGNNVSLEFSNVPEQESAMLVLGNEELLFTAIRNIVANACKYSADHHAQIVLEVKEKEFLIRVSDRGIGIAKTELENIFQPFYRAGEAGGISGFGLGLSLAMRIIKLHKGKISVNSTPGLGSIFTIELPATNG